MTITRNRRSELLVHGWIGDRTRDEAIAMAAETYRPAAIQPKVTGAAPPVINPQAIIEQSNTNTQIPAHMQAHAQQLMAGGKPGGTVVGNILRAINPFRRKPGGTAVGNWLREVVGREAPKLIDNVADAANKYVDSQINRLPLTPQTPPTPPKPNNNMYKPKPIQAGTFGSNIVYIIIGIILLAGAAFSGTARTRTRTRTRTSGTPRLPRLTRAERAPRAPRWTSTFSRRIHGKLYTDSKAWGRAMKRLRNK